jgi:hypothetical protein
MQQSLFNQSENIAPISEKVIRIKSRGASLSKEQQTFNRLVKRVENLRKQLEEDTAKMDELNKLYHQEITPRVTELSSLEIQLCHLLDSKRKSVKLSHIRNGKLDDLIMDFLDDALSVTEPDEATQKLYKKYFGETFDESEQQIEQDVKELFRETFYNQFGVDIDPSLLTDNPDFEKIAASVQQQMDEGEQKRKRRPETKKQKEKEVQERQKQDLKNKSLRSIYLSLAKLLHPDAELDETLKHEKEELMKQVTKAYNDRDMMHLLQLEMQWVKNHTNELDKMNTDTLTIYQQLLKDQVKDLEAEHEMLFNSPAYASVAIYRYENIAMARADIIRNAGNYKKTNDSISIDIAGLQKGNREYAVIRDCIDKYHTDSELPF